MYFEEEIKKRNIPCWYELSFDHGKNAILIRIHKDFIRKYTNLPNFISRHIDDLAKSFQLKPFRYSFVGNFGFNGVFLFDGRKGEFCQFRAAIPVINPEEKRAQGIWNHIVSYSATFTILFRLLNIYDQKTTSELSQLMMIRAITEEGLSGGEICGVFSQKIYFWMKRLASKKSEYGVNDVERVMRLVYERLFATYGLYNQRDFMAEIHEDGGFHADIPGNSCGLDPSLTHGIKEGMGYEFCPHNVDGIGQQLTLLAGLAALHDKARKEGA